MRSTLLTRSFAIAVAAAALSACGGANDDLRAYIDEVKARPGGRIEPLPQVQPAPTFVYQAVPAVKGDWVKVGSLLGVKPEGASHWGVGVVRRMTRDGESPATSETRLSAPSAAPGLRRCCRR